MATIQNPAGYATPVGASLGRLAQVFASAPGPYDREAREATAEAARALADERRLKIDQARAKTAAQGRLGSLFTRGMGEAPETPLAPGAMGPNPQMPRDDFVRGLTPEVVTEGLRAGIENPEQLGQMVFQLFKLGGASDTQAGQAYPGLIGENQAVSLGDREKVAARNQGNEIAKIFAKPVDTAAGAITTFAPTDPRGGPVMGRDTESTAKGAIVNKAAGGGELTPLAQQIVGAMDKSAAPGAPARLPTRAPDNYVWAGPTGQQVRALSYDGRTTLDGAPIPATAQRVGLNVQAGSTSDITKATETRLQGSDVSMRRFRSLLDQTRGKAQADPMNFGIPGFVKGGMQDARAIAQGLTQALGYQTPNEAVANAAQRLSRDGVNPELLKGVFDPTLPALQTTADLLVFAAAEALADQQGRGISDRDVVMFKQIVGDPQALTMNQEKFLAKLGTLEEVILGREGSDAAFRAGQPYSPPASAAPVVKWGRGSDGRPVPLGQ